MTALTCVSISHISTSFDLSRLRKEARDLRDELGYLTVEDANELHAIALAAEEAYASKKWRWRLHAPEGRKFRVCYKFSELPQDDLPNGDYHFFEDIGGKPFEGEISLGVSVVKDPNGVWRLVLDPRFVGDEFSSTRTMQIENSQWLDEDASMSWNITGSDTTESVSQGESMTLVRLRRTKKVGANAVTVDQQPTDGIMVWIQEQ